MKMCAGTLAGLFVFALAACSSENANKQVVEIHVCIDSEVGGNGMGLRGKDRYEAEGWGTGGTVGGGTYRVAEKYEVHSTGSAQFSVQANYTIDRDGQIQSLDRTLPVWASVPGKAKWIKLQEHLWAYAYIIGAPALK